MERSLQVAVYFKCGMLGLNQRSENAIYTQEKISENSRYFGIRVSHFNDHKFITQSQQHLNAV